MTSVDFNEIGVTNLGPVPSGMSFAEAIEIAKKDRKYTLLPYEYDARLTICNTLRMIYQETDKLPDGPEKKQIREYVMAAGDFAKRMDERMKFLKKELNDISRL